MNETKFTPGPWSLTNDETYIRPDCLRGRLPLDAAEQNVTYTWPSICSVTPWPQERWDCLGPEESRANARLIAAAPALYEALSLTHACGTLRDDGTCDGCAVSAALALVDGPQATEVSK